MASDSTDETFRVRGRELTATEFNEMCRTFSENFAEFVGQNQNSATTQLLSYLALLNTYIPKSYLLMSECLQILGPPDPIHGGLPFEERMEPFTRFINTANVCMSHPEFAKTAVQLLDDEGISRSAIVKKLMSSLGRGQPQPHTMQFIKDLLLKRESGDNGKETFSWFIKDIEDRENISEAVSVMETASEIFEQDPYFPQNVSRLCYIRQEDYEKAEEWAQEAIKRAKCNSYIADTLGQVYKNRLRADMNHLMGNDWQPGDVFSMAEEAFNAFKEVERKADNEVGPDMNDEGDLSDSNSFNNRGLFGFVQVAKIAFEKLSQKEGNLHEICTPEEKLRYQNLTTEAENKFDFFEWYLTYSKPDMTTLEPPYFWRDVVLCYKNHARKMATMSTSFPGLLDRLNRGLFTSKGRHAWFRETEITVSELEEIQRDLKTTYESNDGDVKAAERYILSNIILSNKMPDSPQLTPMTELQAILQRFLGTKEESRSPEFYLLVLLLFWPGEQSQVVPDDKDNEEMKQQTDEEQDTKGRPTKLSLESMLHVTFMEEAFQRAGYAKYLRGRYLFPLFFLGRGSGMSKWIHKSKLDAIVENKVNAELASEPEGVQTDKEKWRRIDKMWISGKVWEVSEIQDLLVQVELFHSPSEPQKHEGWEVLAFAGRKKIKAKAAFEPDASAVSTMLFYLGFTIQGPVFYSAAPKV